ncbi:MAG: DUF479 domain-containing protein [Leptolyngbyaceae cyanobacterium RU_5_1]|nr:DUF479 domain-containing protein [Leptolyngbyaceae cyanobacterium RU_5_1]
MNYLAHLYLANETPELIIGSILGDFVKGTLQNLYTPDIRNGIELHRKIDSYTDSHQVVHASKCIITAQRRRFAGIMIDLFYDHFLAKSWSQYSSISLYDFSQHVYGVLVESQAILPDSLGKILPYMIEQNWLISYQEINHIGRALNGISRRLKRPNSLLNSAEELEWNYLLFEENFQIFFPELINFVEHHKECAISSAVRS